MSDMQNWEAHCRLMGRMVCDQWGPLGPQRDARCEETPPSGKLDGIKLINFIWNAFGSCVS